MAEGEEYYATVDGEKAAPVKAISYPHGYDNAGYYSSSSLRKGRGSYQLGLYPCFSSLDKTNPAKQAFCLNLYSSVIGQSELDRLRADKRSYKVEKKKKTKKTTTECYLREQYWVTVLGYFYYYYYYYSIIVYVMGTH